MIIMKTTNMIHVVCRLHGKPIHNKKINERAYDIYYNNYYEQAERTKLLNYVNENIVKEGYNPTARGPALPIE